MLTALTLALLSQLLTTDTEPTASAHEGGRLVVVETRPTPLLPERTIRPDCFWDETPVYCQQKCSCVEVLSRLEEARIELDRNWADVAQWEPALKGWRIFITNQQYLKTPTGALAYGVVFGDEKRMVLSRDMCGVLHELVHVHEIFKGTNQLVGPLDHSLWEQNDAIRELSSRFKLRYRNRPP